MYIYIYIIYIHVYMYINLHIKYYTLTRLISFITYKIFFLRSKHANVTSSVEQTVRVECSHMQEAFNQIVNYKLRITIKNTLQGSIHCIFIPCCNCSCCFMVVLRREIVLGNLLFENTCLLQRWCDHLI